MTNYERGRSYEYKTIKILEAAGYDCTRAAGSHGVWDVLGFSRWGSVVCQVKVGRGIAPAELETARDYPVPANCTKLIHEWTKGQPWPKVTIL